MGIRYLSSAGGNDATIGSEPVSGTPTSSLPPSGSPGTIPVASSGTPVYPEPTPVQKQTTQEIVAEESAVPVGLTETMSSPVEVHRKVQIEIEKDSASAIQQILTVSGGLRNSSAVQALQQANIETEKYIHAARELEGTVLTKQQEFEKRTEFQTAKLTDEIMKKLSNNPDYEPGTENYAAARASVTEKVRAIIERQNRDLF